MQRGVVGGRISPRLIIDDLTFDALLTDVVPRGKVAAAVKALHDKLLITRVCLRALVHQYSAESAVGLDIAYDRVERGLQYRQQCVPGLKIVRIETLLALQVIAGYGLLQAVWVDAADRRQITDTPCAPQMSSVRGDPVNVLRNTQVLCGI